MNREIAKVGTKRVDIEQLTAIEAVSMSVVAVLAITLGTIYGSIL